MMSYHRGKGGRWNNNNGNWAWNGNYGRYSHKDSWQNQNSRDQGGHRDQERYRYSNRRYRNEYNNPYPNQGDHRFNISSQNNNSKINNSVEPKYMKNDGIQPLLKLETVKDNALPVQEKILKTPVTTKNDEQLVTSSNNAHTCISEPSEDKSASNKRSSPETRTKLINNLVSDLLRKTPKQINDILTNPDHSRKYKAAFDALHKEKRIAKYNELNQKFPRRHPPPGNSTLINPAESVDLTQLPDHFVESILGLDANSSFPSNLSDDISTEQCSNLFETDFKLFQDLDCVLPNENDNEKSKMDQIYVSSLPDDSTNSSMDQIHQMCEKDLSQQITKLMPSKDNDKSASNHRENTIPENNSISCVADSKTNFSEKDISESIVSSSPQSAEIIKSDAEKLINDTKNNSSQTYNDKIKNSKPCPKSKKKNAKEYNEKSYELQFSPIQILRNTDLKNCENMDLTINNNVRNKPLMNEIENCESSLKIIDNVNEILVYADENRSLKIYPSTLCKELNVQDSTDDASSRKLIENANKNLNIYDIDIMPSANSLIERRDAPDSTKEASPQLINNSQDTSSAIKMNITESNINNRLFAIDDISLLQSDAFNEETNSSVVENNKTNIESKLSNTKIGNDVSIEMDNSKANLDKPKEINLANTSTQTINENTEARDIVNLQNSNQLEAVNKENNLKFITDEHLSTARNQTINSNIISDSNFEILKKIFQIDKKILEMQMERMELIDVFLASSNNSIHQQPNKMVYDSSNHTMMSLSNTETIIGVDQNNSVNIDVTANISESSNKTFSKSQKENKKPKKRKDSDSVDLNSEVPNKKSALNLTESQISKSKKASKLSKIKNKEKANYETKKMNSESKKRVAESNKVHRKRNSTLKDKTLKKHSKTTKKLVDELIDDESLHNITDNHEKSTDQSNSSIDVNLSENSNQTKNHVADSNSKDHTEETSSKNHTQEKNSKDQTEESNSKNHTEESNSKINIEELKTKDYTDKKLVKEHSKSKKKSNKNDKEKKDTKSSHRKRTHSDKSEKNEKKKIEKTPKKRKQVNKLTSTPEKTADGTEQNNSSTLENSNGQTKQSFVGIQTKVVDEQYSNADCVSITSNINSEDSNSIASSNIENINSSDNVDNSNSKIQNLNEDRTNNLNLIDKINDKKSVIVSLPTEVYNKKLLAKTLQTPKRSPRNILKSSSNPEKNSDVDLIDTGNNRLINKGNSNESDLSINLPKCRVVLERMDLNHFQNLKSLPDENKQKTDNLQVITDDSANNNEIRNLEIDSNSSAEENFSQKDSFKMSFTDHKEPVVALCEFDSIVFAASEDGCVYTYDTTNGNLSYVMRRHYGAVTCLGIESKTLYTVGLDARLQCCQIIDQENKELKEIILEFLANLSGPAQTFFILWGRIYIGTRSGTLDVYDIAKKKVVDSFNFGSSSILSVVCTREGPRKILLVATKEKTLSVRDAHSGLSLREMYPSCALGITPAIYCLSLQGHKIYCGTSGTNIDIFNYTSGELIGSWSGGRGAVCLKEYRGVLFSGCYDGNVYAHRLVTGALLGVMNGPGKLLLCICIVGDKIMAGTKDNALVLWKIPENILKEMTCL